VRADIGQRTRESGRAFVQGMFPGCPTVTHTVEAAADPLFLPVPEFAHGDAALAAAAVSGRCGNNPAALASTLQHAFGTLREVLFGCAIEAPCPGRSSRGNRDCSICRRRLAARRTALPTSADLSRPVPHWPKISGSNTRGKDLGWGRLDETRLREIRAIHVAYADLTRRTQYLAGAQGSSLLSHILHSMEQAVSGHCEDIATQRPWRFGRQMNSSAHAQCSAKSIY
jgi:4-phytase/acid phosphatase